MARILVIDDAPQIRKFLRISLGANGHAVAEAATAKEGLAAFRQEPPDLVILDLGLPDQDGQEAITAIRALSPVPILVLSVRAHETDKVEALDRGANDYIVKPFGIGELMARVRVALRRTELPPADDLVEVGSLRLDFARRAFTRAGKPIRLSRKEFDLLYLLARHADHVVTHLQLLREVWGPAHTEDTAYLRVYVNQLRQKLEEDPAHPTLIVTDPGVGYRLRLSD